MWEWAAPILQQYGLSGIVIAFLVYALIRVDSRRDQEIDARYRDALEWQKAIITNTAAMEAIAERLEAQARVIEALSASLRATSEALNVLHAALGRDRRGKSSPDG